MIEKQNKWELNRIGFFNFWYYRAKFIPFYDSKMVIRGSNSSGKSLTMQAVLPVILDGITTNRMNSFSRSGRKIQDIMLGKEEFTHMKDKKKTGYISLELKQKHTNRYITLLIGLQAQRNEDLKKWYAVLENERLTIDGEGFKLFTITDNKMYYFDKKKLVLELEDKGRVFNTRQEYQEYVNDTIFGFETIEEFDNAINSLLSLRAPKLGSDTKVRDVFSMLESALPTVKDETIKELDDSFKSLQKLNDHLEIQREQLNLLSKLDEKNSKYVDAKLAQLAGIYIKLLNDFNKTVDESKENKEILANTEGILTGKNNLLSDKKNKFDTLNDIIERLQLTSGTYLATQETDIRKKIAEFVQQISSEEIEIIKTKVDIKKYKDEAFLYEKEIKDIKEEIEEILEELTIHAGYFHYEEHAELMRRTIENEPDIFEMNVPIWLDEMRLLRSQLDDIKDKIKEYDEARKINKQLLQEEEKVQKDYDRFNKEKEKAEENLHLNKTTYIEKFNIWLQKPDIAYSDFAISEVNQNFSKMFTEKYSTVSQVLDPLTQDAIELQSKERTSKLYPIQEAIYQLEEKINMIYQELELLKEGAEEHPYQSDLRKKSRGMLYQNAVLAKPFYEVVEFQKNISIETHNYLEAALLESGIVDALVSPEILNLENDVQLFPNPGYDPNILEFGSSLADYLIPDSSLPQDFRTCVEHILASIQMDEGTDKARYTIRTDGRFEIGVLKGQVSSKYQSIFIGKTSREKRRKEKIILLQEKMKKNKQQLNELKKEEKEILDYLNTIVDYLKNYPDTFNWKKAFDYNLIAWERLKEVTNQWKHIEDMIQKSEVSIQQTKRVLQQYGLNHQINEQLLYSIKRVNDAQSHLNNYYQLINDLDKKLIKSLSTGDNLEVKENAIITGKEKLENLEYSLDNHKADRLIQEEVLKENLKQQKEEGIYDNLQKLQEKKVERDSLDKEIQELNIELVNLKRDKETYEQMIYKGIKLISENQYFMMYWREMLIEAVDINNREIKPEQSFDTYARNLRKKELTEEVLAELQRELEAEFVMSHYKLRNLSPKRTEVILGEIKEHSYEENVDRWDQIKRHQKHLRLVYELGEGENSRELPVEAAFLSLFNTVEIIENTISSKDTQIWKDIFTQSLGVEIRQLIQHVLFWKDEINDIMSQVQFSRGFTLKLEWAERADLDELDVSTREIIRMFNRSQDTFKEEDYQKISRYFGTKIDQAIEINNKKDYPEDVFNILKNILDYRKWFGFKLYYTSNERANWTFMSDAQFRDLSGGERGLSMYLPMLAAINSQYKKASPNAPYIITADEAFAGIDETNIGEMFKVLQQLGFSYILNSHNLRAEKKDVSNIVTHEIRSYDKEQTVTISTSFWDGHEKLTVGSGISEQQLQEVFGEWKLNEKRGD